MNKHAADTLLTALAARLIECFDKIPLDSAGITVRFDYNTIVGDASLIELARAFKHLGHELASAKLDVADSKRGWFDSESSQMGRLALFERLEACICNVKEHESASLLSRHELRCRLRHDQIAQKKGK